MNIVPSSTIYLLKNVPLDPDFQHSIRFTSKTAQINYFGTASLHVATFDRQSYQRYPKGRLRVSALADDLYQCNYLCFQNTGHGLEPKWFYAFVTSVEYVNENTTEILYQIDPIQTYMFDYNLGYCFVEREHCQDDTLYYQLVPEDLECGEYVTTQIGYVKFDPEISVYSTYDLHATEADVPSAGGYSENDGVYSGLQVIRYGANVASCNSLTQSIMDSPGAVKAEGITQMRVTPTLMGNIKGYNSDTDTITGGSLKYVVKPQTIDSYTPRNKKLFTSPFITIMADDNQGNRTQYLMEFFGDYDAQYHDRMYFQFVGTYEPTPILSMIPLEYKGARNAWSERMLIRNFPSCTWSSSTYKEWVARNETKLTTSGVLSVASIGIGAVTKNPKMVGAGITGIATLLSQIKDKSVDPYSPKGDATGDALMYGLKYSGVFFYKVSITQPMAEIIDTFFDTYGYAVNKVKKPNLFGGGRLRPRWNYLKTRNCQLATSNCPADDAKKICNIYDNGITFWNNPNEVADYSNPSTNAPVEGT